MTIALLLMAVLLSAPAAAAGSQESGRQEASVPLLDAEQLPVSLERIRRELRSRPMLDPESLRLSYYVEVYAKRPQLDVFAGFDLHNSPVPYGAPSHREIIDLVTPLEFRSPPADLTGVLNWLLGRGGQKPR